MKEVHSNDISTSSFHLKSLRLHDFRGLRDIEIDFNDQLTVFIGVNGAGKTSILDAIGGSFQVIEAILRNRTGRYLPETAFLDTDIFNESNFAQIKVDSVIEYDQVRNDNAKAIDISWSHDLTREGFTYLPDNLDELERYAESIQERLRDGQKVNIPVLAYYQLQKAANSIGQQELGNDAQRSNIYTIFNAYDGALDQGRFNYLSFFRWYRQQYGQVNQSKNGDAAWKVVTQAIYDFYGTIAGAGYLSDLAIDWSLAVEGELVVKKRGVQIKVGQLSSGEKSLILLVADLARRLCMANPAAKKPLEGYGTVLIDEIDIHLHPHWQRGVISALQATFPNLQFIMTTHSPLVLQGIRAEHIQILEDGKIESVRYSLGQDVSTILEANMETDPLPDKVKETIKKLSILIQENKLEEASKLIATIEQDLLEGPLGAIEHAKAIIRRKQLIAL